MIFIDFDDVIFNTKEFKHDFKNVFIEFGVPSKIFDKHYKESNDKNIIRKFDPFKQIKKIEKELHIDSDSLISLIEKFLSDISKYVFDDVKKFVSLVDGEKICIVSFGEKNFQTKKIQNSKVPETIKDFIVVENLKSEAIAKVLENELIGKNETIFFVDDRIEQIRDVRNGFPNIVTIFLKRPEGRYQEMQKEKCCDFQACNLIEAAKIVKKYEKD